VGCCTALTEVPTVLLVAGSWLPGSWLLVWQVAMALAGSSPRVPSPHRSLIAVGRRCRRRMKGALATNERKHEGPRLLAALRETGIEPLRA
jgi:hypothetical protein